MNPRLVGARFDEHSIPLEVLKDLAALEELIVEVAKWHYRKDNPDRQRIPRGFTDQVSLKIAAIGGGSVIPEIVLSIADASTTLFPFDHRECFEKARQSVIYAVDAADKGEPIQGRLTDSQLAYFDRIGRSLRDDECIELNYQDAGQPARLNKASRRSLTMAASSIQQFTEEISLRGAICEADQRKSRFELELIDKTVIRSPIQAEHLEQILDAFQGYQSGVRVAIEGIGRYDRRGKLTGLESVEEITLLDSMDVASRLDEFRILKNGWFEGKGQPPKPEGLDWLTERFEICYSDELPLPFLYPTAEGGVQAEWSLGGWEISMDIDLKTKQAYWHQLNSTTDEDTDQEIDLSTVGGWEWIGERISELVGGQAS